MAEILSPAISDATIAKANTRYPGTAVQRFKGTYTITLNPTEPQGWRRFNLGLEAAKEVLRKYDAIKRFYDKSGLECPQDCEVTDFKKKKILCINPTESPRRQFGLDKSGLIVMKIEAIRNFVSVYGGKAACEEFNLTQPE